MTSPTMDAGTPLREVRVQPPFRMTASLEDGKRKGEESTAVEESWRLWKWCIVALPQLGVQALWMFGVGSAKSRLRPSITVLVLSSASWSGLLLGLGLIRAQASGADVDRS